MDTYTKDEAAQQRHSLKGNAIHDFTAYHKNTRPHWKRWGDGSASTEPKA